MKHEETQLILSEKQLISFSLSGICVPACTPLHVHVVAVYTAILTHCILYLALAGMPAQSVDYMQPSQFNCRAMNCGWSFLWPVHMTRIWANYSLTHMLKYKMGKD